MAFWPGGTGSAASCAAEDGLARGPQAGMIVGDKGASRCPPCARRSWARSGEHRGLPVLPPRVTVIEIATGVNHGTWDGWEDVVMCLAFAKLSRDQVELIPDM